MNEGLIIKDFESAVLEFPQRIAIEESKGTIAYSDLNKSANRLSALLKKVCVEKETIVGVMLPSGINLIRSLIAIFKTGAVYLPMDFAFARKRFQQIFAQTSCDIIITDYDFVETVKSLLEDLEVSIKTLIVFKGEEVLLFEYKQNKFELQSFTETFTETNPENGVLPEDSNYIFYTSGSTGEGKAILGDHKGLHHFINWEKKEFGIDENIKVSQLTQFTFDASLRDIFLPLSSGGKLCIPPVEARSNFVQLAEWINESEINLIHCVPSLFRLMTKELAGFEANKPALSQLKYIIMAGEVLYGKDIINWTEAAGNHVELVNLYGTSETTMAKTFHRISETPSDPSQIIHVGKPIDNAMIIIINNNQLCRIGEIGEVYIKTPFRTKGYYKNEVLTNQVFLRNPLITEKEDIIYKTGDLGRYQKDRSVEILGRMDEQVKVNGIRIELNEIKQAVLKKAGVSEAVIMAFKNNENQNELVCYYISEEVESEELRLHLKTEINENYIPAYFVKLEEFPLNINGKVDKKALPKPESILFQNHEYEAPVNATEEKLEKIWQEVLGLSRIGRKISFFKIGGTSLKAIQVISRIYKELGVNIRISEIFSNSTIGELGIIIENASGETYEEIKKVPDQEFYELSPSQKRLWFLDQLDDDSSAYNMSDAYILEGKLNKEALQTAFLQLIERHESLRTTFISVSGVPMQKINSVNSAEFEVEFLELEKTPELVGNIVSSAASEAFDLQEFPLFSAKVLYTEREKCIFIFTIHHIISDGWSMEVLFEELVAFYNNAAKNLSTSVPSLEIQYKDYAAWLNAKISGEKAQTHRQYWLSKLSGEVPVLELPIKTTRPSVKSFNGSNVVFKFPKDESEKLVRKGQQLEVSTFMLLVAAVKVILHKYSGQEDIILGTPVFGRNHKQLEDQIGFFVNTLPLRTQFDQNESFEILLQKVKNTVLEAFEHELYPFDKLVDELKLTRDLSRSPLFDVMITLHNQVKNNNEARMGEMTVSEYQLETSASKYDLSFDFFEFSENITVNIEYNTDLFAQEQVQRMAVHLSNLFRSVTENANIPVNLLEYISEAEREELLIRFNDTKAEFPLEKTIQQLFEEQVDKTPENFAVFFEEKSISYAILNERANQLAHYLRSIGVTKEKFVGVYMERGIDLVVALMAILKSGGAYVPFDKLNPIPRTKSLMNNSEVSVLFTEVQTLQNQEALFSDLPHLKHVVLFETSDAEFPKFEVAYKIQLHSTGSYSYLTQPSENPHITVNATDWAYMLYTSGSTGEPKGAILRHDGAVNHIFAEYKSLSLPEGFNFLQSANISSDISVWQFLAPLLCGGATVIISKDDLLDYTKVVSLLQRRRITIAEFVPSYLIALIECIKNEDQEKFRLPDMQWMMMVGEEVPVQLVNAWINLYPNVKVLNGYGPCEASDDISQYLVAAPLNEATFKKVPIGKPLSNLSIFILDNQNKLVPKGVTGQICVSGVGVGAGYWKDAEKTSKSFITNTFEGTEGDTIYTTGDLGKWLEDGNLEFLGRKDSQVKIRGFRVETGEIESILRNYPGVKDCVAEVKKDKEGERHLIGYLILNEKERKESLITELKHYAGIHLPDYMVPEAYVVLQEFPYNLSDKVDRKRLPMPEVLESYSGTVYLAPRNETEEKLVAIWKDVLGKEQVGVTDNFFAIGGHSLKAIVLTSRIHQVFGKQVSLKEIFSRPTIEQLSLGLQELNKEEYAEITPASDKPYYALSSSQRRLYILHQMEPESSNYNISGICELEGEIERNRFENAFKELIARHESLRTNFLVKDAEIVQVVRQEVDFSIFYYKSTDAISTEKIIADLDGPFDLENESLLRVGLIDRQDTGSHLLLLNIHHIISDGASEEIIREEFVRLYEGETLPALRIQYKDYAEWQQARMQTVAFKVHENYWLEELQGELPVLNMPTDHPRPVIQGFSGEVLEFSLDEKLRKKIEAACTLTGSTLYMYLLSCYKILLHKYTGQNDILVGSPVSGRTHADLEAIIGVFVNTVVLRSQPQSEKTFGQYLSEVKEKALSALTHQDYQFDDLVDKLDLPRDLSRNPIFDVMFVLQNTAVETEDNYLEDIQVRPYESEHKVSKFDLTLTAEEQDGKLHFSLEYNTDLFERETINRLKNHYVNILTAVSENEDVQLKNIDILESEEREQLLRTFNDTDADFPKEKTIQALIEEQVERTPNSTAIIFGNTILTYKELNERSNQLAHYLREEHRIKPNDLVGLMSERSEKIVIALLGILKACGAYVCVDKTYPEDRRNFILEDSAVRVLITDDAVEIERAGSKDYKVISLHDCLGAISKYAVTNPFSVNKPDDLSYITYTSGSTGKPKGVMIMHYNMVAFVSWAMHELMNSDFQTVFAATSYCFDISVFEMFYTLAAGKRARILGSGLQITDYLLTDSKIMIHTVPSMIDTLLKANADWSNVTVVGIGGEPLPMRIVKALDCGRMEVKNLYGPSEDTVWSSTYTFSGKEDKITIGKPIHNTKFYILDEQLHLLPRGITGEVCISGKGVAKGYFNRPELTAEKFIPNPYWPGERLYLTGDVGRWLPDGNIEFFGRKDHQIKIRGFRIEIGEIENTFRKYEGIGEVLVMGRDDKEGNKYLAAYYTSVATLEEEAIKAHLGTFLPEYMIPAYFIQLDKFPLNHNGKIERKSLPSPEEITSGNKSAYVAAGNYTEEKLVEAWEAVLGKTPISVEDNFFRIGGHSLHAVHVVNRIRKSLGKEIELKDLFRYPVLKDLAQQISNYKTEQYVTIPSAETKPYYRLSSSQRRLYILQQMETGSVSYNMLGASELTGNIDMARFEQAFKTLTKRHESLRTNFLIKNTELVQVIHGEVRFSVDHYQSTDFETLKNIIEEFGKPFDLEKDVLFKVGLVKQLNTGAYTLLTNIHHIISDGASEEIIREEFVKLYMGETLPALRIQYKDYAEWQQSKIENNAFEAHENYWLEEMKGELPVLNMPADHLRPVIQSFRGDVMEFSVQGKLREKIEGACSLTGSTLYMFLLSCYKILLHKYTGQQDILVGSPVSGRTHADLEGIIGMFVNTVVLRSQPQSDKTFGQYISEVKEKTLGALTHQEYQFDDLVDRLDLPRDLSRNPVFDIMFVLQNTGAETEDSYLEDIQVKVCSTEEKISKFDLTLTAGEQYGTINFSLEYNTDLFERETIERLRNHYVNILEAVSEDVNVQLKNIDILEADERRQLLHIFNNTEAAYPKDKTIHTLFEEQAEKTPNSLAVFFGNKSLTYRELNERSNQLAHHLREFSKVSPDTIVAILTDRSAEMIISILGVLKAGAAYLPIDPVYPAERISYMLKDSAAKVVLAPQKYQKHVKGEDISFVEIESYEVIQNQPKNNLSLVNTSKDLAYVIYTSGSTGQPKGVMIEHRSLVNYIWWAAKEYVKGEPMNFLLHTSFSFDLTVTTLFTPLITGNTIYVNSEEAGTEMLPKHNLGIVKLTPSHLKMISHEENHSSAIKRFIVGGEALETSLAKRIYDNFNQNIEIYNEYGPTEATVGCMIYQFNPEKDQELFVSIGKPAANTEILILDQDLHLVPAGVTGEMYIGGDCLARGYLNRPDLTAERFINHPFKAGERLYKTGDLGKILSDGTITYLGRNDDQVKIRGNRIELAEIEKLISKYEEVKETVVLAREDKAGDKYLVCYYISVGENTLEETMIRKFLAAQLPSYMVPAVFIKLDTFPLTQNGKLDKNALPNPEGENLTGKAEYVAPTDKTEKALVQIWEEILEKDKVGIRDNFFETGGHSLKAVRVISKIYKELNVKLELRNIFLHPTIEDLAVIIRESKTVVPYEEIKSIENQAQYDISFAQRALWITDQLEEKQVAYNMPTALIMQGDLNKAAFEKAINALLARHESLRTSFIIIKGEPKQKVNELSELGFQIAFSDIRAEKNVEAKARTMAEEEATTWFNLAVGPLIRVKLIQTEDNKHLLLFTLHHIIADGWSIHVIAKELLVLYNSFAENQENPLSPLRIQYKDYVAWQRKQLSGANLEKHENYWLNLFQENIPQLELPLDHERSVAKSYHGSTLYFNFDQELSSSLYALSKQNESTLFMTLFASVNILLHHYSGQEDIITGMPEAGRNHEDLENQVGMFINTLALRTAIDSKGSFQELLLQVKENMLEAYQHSIYPFDKLISSLGLQNTSGRTGLFDVMIMMQNPEEELTADQLEMKDLKVLPFDIEYKTSKQDLKFNFTENGHMLTGDIEFNDSLFSQSTIEGMKNTLIRLLTIVSRQPKAALWEIKQMLLNESDKNFLQAKTEMINSEISEEF